MLADFLDDKKSKNKINKKFFYLLFAAKVSFFAKNLGANSLKILERAISHALPVVKGVRGSCYVVAIGRDGCLKVMEPAAVVRDGLDLATVQDKTIHTISTDPNGPLLTALANSKSPIWHTLTGQNSPFKTMFTGSNNPFQGMDTQGSSHLGWNDFIAPKSIIWSILTTPNNQFFGPFIAQGLFQPLHTSQPPLKIFSNIQEVKQYYTSLVDKAENLFDLTKFFQEAFGVACDHLRTTGHSQDVHEMDTLANAFMQRAQQLRLPSFDGGITSADDLFRALRPYLRTQFGHLHHDDNLGLQAVFHYLGIANFDLTPRRFGGLNPFRIQQGGYTHMLVQAITNNADFLHTTGEQNALQIFMGSINTGIFEYNNASALNVDITWCWQGVLVRLLQGYCLAVQQAGVRVSAL